MHGDNYARSNAIYPPETVAIHWHKPGSPTAFKKLKRIVELEYNFVRYYSTRKEKKKKEEKVNEHCECVDFQTRQIVTRAKI